VVQDTGRGGEDDVSESSRRKEQSDPVLDIPDGDVVTGRDDTGLVKSSVQLDDDFSRTVVVDDLELADVAVALHHAEELDNDLGGRADEDLTLATALGVDDVVKAVVKDGYANHF
jgi:hypothetical protein